MADETVLGLVVGGCIGALGAHLLDHSSTDRIILTVAGGVTIWALVSGKL